MNQSNFTYILSRGYSGSTLLEMICSSTNERNRNLALGETFLVYQRIKNLKPFKCMCENKLIDEDIINCPWESLKKDKFSKTNPKEITYFEMINYFVNNYKNFNIIDSSKIYRPLLSWLKVLKSLKKNKFNINVIVLRRCPIEVLNSYLRQAEIKYFMTSLEKFLVNIKNISGGKIPVCFRIIFYVHWFILEIYREIFTYIIRFFGVNIFKTTLEDVVNNYDDFKKRMSLNISLNPKYNLPLFDHLNCHIAVGSHTRIDNKARNELREIRPSKIKYSSIVERIVKKIYGNLFMN